MDESCCTHCVRWGDCRIQITPGGVKSHPGRDVKVFTQKNWLNLLRYLVVNGGITTRATKDEMINYPDFSIRPRVCINKVVGQNIRMTLSYEQRNLGVLHDNDVDTNYNYKLENVKVCFMTAPDQKPQPLTMINTLCLQSSLTSAVTNLSSKVSAVCNSTSASFLQQDREYSPNFDNVELEEPPRISRMSCHTCSIIHLTSTCHILDSDDRMGHIQGRNEVI